MWLLTVFLYFLNIYVKFKAIFPLHLCQSYHTVILLKHLHFSSFILFFWTWVIFKLTWQTHTPIKKSTNGKDSHHHLINHFRSDPCQRQLRCKYCIIMLTSYSIELVLIHSSECCAFAPVKIFLKTLTVETKHPKTYTLAHAYIETHSVLQRGKTTQRKMVLSGRVHFWRHPSVLTQEWNGQIGIQLLPHMHSFEFLHINKAKHWSVSHRRTTFHLIRLHRGVYSRGYVQTQCALAEQWREGDFPESGETQQYTVVCLLFFLLCFC